MIVIALFLQTLGSLPFGVLFLVGGTVAFAVVIVIVIGVIGGVSALIGRMAWSYTTAV